MARAGLVRLSDVAFEKDGKQIPYRKVNLTRVGHSVDEQTPIEFVMKVAMPTPADRKGKKRAVANAKRNRQRKMETRPSKTRSSCCSHRIGFASGSGFAWMAHIRSPRARCTCVSDLRRQNVGRDRYATPSNGSRATWHFGNWNRLCQEVRSSDIPPGE
jgi:hypothetical protein